METQSCLILDASTLNAVYKYKNRFSIAVNYSNPAKLTQDAMSLPTNSDLYIVMLPRQKGEGDVIIPELSFGEIPFVASKVELLTLQAIFKDVNKITNIYLCNGLYNISRYARVKKADISLHYGNRIALVSIEDNLPYSLKVYNDIQEFHMKLGNIDCYNEIEIIDTNALIARYSELSSMRKQDIALLTPLFGINNSCKVELNQFLTSLCSEKPDEVPDNEVNSSEKPEEVKLIADESRVKFSEELVGKTQNKVAREEYKSKPKAFNVRKKFKLSNVFISIVSCTIIGVSLGLNSFVDKSQALMLRNDELAIKSSIYEQLSLVYSNVDKAFELSEQIIYAKSSALAVKVESVTSNTDKTVIRVIIDGNDVASDYAEYLSRKYTLIAQDILSTNTLSNGVVQNVILFTIC